MKLAQATESTAKQRALRIRAEDQLQQVKGSRLWPIIRALYSFKRRARARLQRIRARAGRRGAPPPA